MLQGIIFCHGHKHKPYLDRLPYYIPAGINWTLVDINEEAEPNIVADYRKVEETITRLGNDRYNYVIDMGCPMIAIRELFNTAHSLLKSSLNEGKGGKFLILSGIKKILSAYSFKYYHHLNNIEKTVTGDLIDVLTEIGAIPTFDQLSQLINATEFIRYNRIMINKYEDRDPLLLELLTYTISKLTSFGNFKSWLIPYDSPNSQQLSTDIIFTK